jgi:copper resistance protein B
MKPRTHNVRKLIWTLAPVLLVNHNLSFSQTPSSTSSLPMQMDGMDPGGMSTMPRPDRPPPDLSTSQTAGGMPKAGDAEPDKPAVPMNPDATGATEMGAMQGGKAPPNARDPDAYAEGLTKTTMPGMALADDERYGRVLINELEYTKSDGKSGQAIDAEAWYGGDINKLWLKAEGQRRNGRLDDLRTEALWDRNLATYWSSQLGLRHDTGSGPARNWLAVGVQGLAPYWFETEATAYVGRSGSLAARLGFKYELLFTQKLILQPKLEANFYSKNDEARNIGSGLSDMEAGLRLRYEIRRQFAPYIGVSTRQKFGNTATFARRAGENVRDNKFVAGLRIWF